MMRALAIVLAAPLALAACVGFSPDGGMAPVVALVGARGEPAVAKVADAATAADAQMRAAALLKHPLRASSAVEVAFLRNRDLQAAFSDLGVAEAAYVKASLPPDPTLTVDFLTGQGDVEVVSQVLAAVYALATLPARTEIAGAHYATMQARTAGRAMDLARDVARQYYVALAAQEQVGFLDQSLAGAQASAEIARQLGEAGNLNKLEQARQDVFYADLGAQRADARLVAQAEREKLTRMLGLFGRDIAYVLPKTMPALPARIASSRDIEAQAIRGRLDLLAARRDLDALARSLGLTQATRYVSGFDLTYQNDHENAGGTGGSVLATETQNTLTRNGFVADISIPIYDFGESKVRGARESYMAAANRLAQMAIDARSQAREAWLRTSGKHDLARYYAQRVLPLRKTILDQSTLQYNGMLADVTQLLIDARGRVASNMAAIGAKRDFFIADVELKAALTGTGPGEASPPPVMSPVGTEAAN